MSAIWCLKVANICFFWLRLRCSMLIRDDIWIVDCWYHSLHIEQNSAQYFRFYSKILTTQMKLIFFVFFVACVQKALYWQYRSNNWGIPLKVWKLEFEILEVQKWPPSSHIYFQESQRHLYRKNCFLIMGKRGFVKDLTFSQKFKVLVI